MRISEYTYPQDSAVDRDLSADQVDNDGDGVVDEPGEACGDSRPPDTSLDAGPDVLASSASATFTFASSLATRPSSGPSTALS